MVYPNHLHTGLSADIRQIDANDRTAVVRSLQQSELFREYRQAFEATTGLPLVLREAGSFLPPLQGSKRENSFCVMMRQTNSTCGACLQLQQQVEEEATREAKTLQCYAGLSESAVPVVAGAQVLGYLQTGQVFLRQPSRQSFKVVTRAIPPRIHKGKERERMAETARRS